MLCFLPEKLELVADRVFGEALREQAHRFVVRGRVGGRLWSAAMRAVCAVCAVCCGSGVSVASPQ
jgi:hypothetical protein